MKIDYRMTPFELGYSLGIIKTFKYNLLEATSSELYDDFRIFNDTILIVLGLRETAMFQWVEEL